MLPIQWIIQLNLKIIMQAFLSISLCICNEKDLREDDNLSMLAELNYLENY